MGLYKDYHKELHENNISYEDNKKAVREKYRKILEEKAPVGSVFDNNGRKSTILEYRERSVRILKSNKYTHTNSIYLDIESMCIIADNGKIIATISPEQVHFLKTIYY